MPASIHTLPTPKAQPAIERDRGDWGALRAELHSRCADQDLAELWSELGIGERKAVLASARMEPGDALISIEDMACLLYTSPSPRDLSTSRMPSSA